MTKSYEMMYILRPNLSDEQIEQEITKYSNLLTDNGAENLEIQKLGKRRLAYIIKINKDEKYQDGIYVQMNYKGDGKQVAIVERAMRLSEEVIRYLTIQLKEPKESVKSADVAASVEVEV